MHYTVHSYDLLTYLLTYLLTVVVVVIAVTAIVILSEFVVIKWWSQSSLS